MGSWLHVFDAVCSSGLGCPPKISCHPLPHAFADQLSRILDESTPSSVPFLPKDCVRPPPSCTGGNMSTATAHCTGFAHGNNPQRVWGLQKNRGPKTPDTLPSWLIALRSRADLTNAPADCCCIDRVQRPLGQWCRSAHTRGGYGGGVASWVPGHALLPASARKGATRIRHGQRLSGAAIASRRRGHLPNSLPISKIIKIFSSNEGSLSD